ncbi:MAG: hypothetical protein AAF449_14680 [Myxococcota bacterium]
MKNRNKLLVGAGVLLIGSGLVYCVVFALSGESWSGPTSLRKPLLFGLSTGVTLLSLAEVARRLPTHRIDYALYASLAGALLLEVALIDLQQARGVASHFNRATTFDASIQCIMSVLIGYATVVILFMTARSFTPLSTTPDQTLVVRAGMVLLSVGCVLGGLITIIGEVNLREGHPPEILGRAGVLKFPHGLPLHAIQILQIQRWGLTRLAIRETTRWRSLVATTVGMTMVTLYGIVQTGLGEPRNPPVAATWPLAVFSATAFVAAVIIVYRNLTIIRS